MTQHITSLEDAERFLETFQSLPGHEKPRTLRRMQTLMDILDHPEHKLKVITVTGSYGKSSTAYIIATLLEHAGLRVGLHIKPHVQKITDRFSINRLPMPDDTFVRLVAHIKPVVETLEEKPTFFELLVAIMILYFVESKVDVAVVEVGRGGRLDATNILDAMILVITDIFLVHTDILGSTKEMILEEKLGLMRKQSTVIAGCEEPNLQKQILQTAKRYQSTVKLLNRDFQLIGDAFTAPDFIVPNVQTFARESHQWKNVCLAIEAARTFIPMDAKIVTAALFDIHIPGRMEEVRYGTLTFIFDAAHNAEKIRFLEKELVARYPMKKFIVVTRYTDDQVFENYRDILRPITKEFIVIDMDRTPSPIGISIDQFITRYLTHARDDWFLVTGGMQLAANLRTRLEIPFTLK